jgi:hypothetical protein
MGYRLNALQEALTTIFSDIFHLRTSGGLDKKITLENLRQGIVSYTAVTSNHTVPETNSEIDKIQRFRNGSVSNITLTLGTSLKTIVLAPNDIAEVVYDGTTFWKITDQGVKTTDSPTFDSATLENGMILKNSAFFIPEFIADGSTSTGSLAICDLIAPKIPNIGDKTAMNLFVRANANLSYWHFLVAERITASGTNYIKLHGYFVANTSNGAIYSGISFDEGETLDARLGNIDKASGWY